MVNINRLVSAAVKAYRANKTEATYCTVIQLGWVQEDARLDANLRCEILNCGDYASPAHHMNNNFSN